MVYKYKRKTKQAHWSEDSMMLAIAYCNSGIPVKTTAKSMDYFTPLFIGIGKKKEIVKVSAKAIKNMKNLNAKPKTATRKNTKTTKNMIDKDKRKDSGKENEEEQYFCGENYIEINKKPVDDWIQCDKCKQWSHEKCTGYEGIDLFFCDICTD
ncbi:hypothetical protein WA026_003180 [Henosepilachna vigintioctopunctata]|uniref:Zinc finger PHD-type domain-containing protein n=1 Tax=Henosepilachna vigintioctopunctata TaxID=420089 RepID=A0AAW1TIL0_9CUCU